MVDNFADRDYVVGAEETDSSSDELEILPSDRESDAESANGARGADDESEEVALATPLAA